MRDIFKFFLAGLLIWVISIVTVSAQNTNVKISTIVTKPVNTNAISDAMRESPLVSLQDETVAESLFSDLQRYGVLVTLLGDDHRAGNQKTLLPIVLEMRDILDRIEQGILHYSRQFDERDEYNQLEGIAFDRKQLERLDNCNSKCVNKISELSRQYGSLSELDAALGKNIRDERQHLSTLVNKLEEGKFVTMMERRRSKNWFCLGAVPLIVFFAFLQIYPIAVAILVLALLFCP